VKASAHPVIPGIQTQMQIASGAFFAVKSPSVIVTANFELPHKAY
jgi:hypothetical protein